MVVDAMAVVEEVEVDAMVGVEEVGVEEEGVVVVVTN